MNQRIMYTRKTRKIPPPPGPQDGYDAIIAYFNTYSTEELEKAGCLEEVSQKEVQKLIASAVFELLCRHGLKIKLKRKEYQQLSELSARKEIPLENLVKKWLRERMHKEL